MKRFTRQRTPVPPVERRTSTPELTEVVHRNIRAMIQARREMERSAPRADRAAEAIARFSGSMPFALLHAALVTLWLVWNTGLLGLEPFDPFPFVMLAMIASVEAIFLSTFVLITQNHMARVADRRSDLDLQIDLLSEHEITRLITLVDAIAKQLGVNEASRPDVEDLKRDVEPEVVLDEIARSDHEPEHEHHTHRHGTEPDARR